MATAQAVAAVKRAKVVEAVAQRATYEEAAKQAGYANRSGAYKAFWKALDGRESEAVQDPGTRVGAPGCASGAALGQGHER